MNSVLHLIGIARKAGRLEIGEEPVGACARAHRAKLIAAAADAAENSLRRAAHFAQQGNTPWLKLPVSKGELGMAVGRTSCAMLAVTDAGLACALAEKLAAAEPERYGETARLLRHRADKALQRQKEQRIHEKKLRAGKAKPWAAPPPKPGAASAVRTGGQGTSPPPLAPGGTGRRCAPRGIVCIKRKEKP